MICCKDLFSLQVLSLYEGELLGKVDKLFFDRKLKKLFEIELISSDGSKFILQTKNIYRIGKNAITVKNNEAVLIKTENEDLCNVPHGSKVYSINGEFLGVIEEIVLNEKYVTQKVLLDNETSLEANNIASIGKNIVIFYNSEKVSINKFHPKNQPKEYKRKNVQVARALPIESKAEDENGSAIVKESIVQNINFLVGRICTKDIYNFNNELLIKANSVVNKKNLKEINKFGKLRELMIYTK